MTLIDEEGFSIQSAMREFRVARGFDLQCRRVLEMVTGARNPDLRLALERISGPEARPAAIMSAFFHYFASHEFLHVEQGLGSDQYKDSDSYMPIVMEADHAADVAGLVITSAAGIPELLVLSPRDRVLILVAIHIASMHSFDPCDGTGLDGYAFSRLLVWYLHFARFTKAPDCPDFTSPTFSRAWTVTLPRLIGRADQRITLALLARRGRKPHAANSDVVLAYQHEDGIYRIHRAALTDRERVLRLAQAIVKARFDDVRVELEELLVNNPALIPEARRSPDVEWAAGAVIDQLEQIGVESRSDGDAPHQRLPSVRAAYDRLRSVARSAAKVTPEFKSLLDRGDELLDELERSDGADASRLSRLRRLTLSVVDQIVLLLA